MTTIVIPACDSVPDAWKYLDELLNSIKVQNLDMYFEIVVAFDGCSGWFLDQVYLNYSFVRLDPKFINFGHRQGYCANVNRALRVLHGQEGKDVILVNQDCILPNHEYLNDLRYGSDLVGPSQCNILTEDKVKGLNSANYYLQPFEKIPCAERLSGFCLYLSKALMDKIGYLNEYLIGGFDDDDLCARAKLAGFEVEQSNITVHHYGSKLNGLQEKDIMMRLNQFHRLWEIPLDIPHEQFQTYIVENRQWEEKLKEK